MCRRPPTGFSDMPRCAGLSTDELPCAWRMAPPSRSTSSSRSTSIRVVSTSLWRSLLESRTAARATTSELASITLKSEGEFLLGVHSGQHSIASEEIESVLYRQFACEYALVSTVIAQISLRRSESSGSAT
ncbi:hypothetical protein ANCCEY_05866 [Ancylostoma ceylanicum]|uniref:Uncharacterized protein n=1 Tax=Ancylostoma ceylanicum TaxID=53326 RepID=A0A0D6LY62_9BILA|nr:hypothetical protein ANCCEY_05866 [Ancylostoma ceylanicum]